MLKQENHAAFAAIYNDVETYPTIGDVANHFEVSPKRIQNFAGELRKLRLGDLVFRGGPAASTKAVEARTVLTAVPDADEPIEQLLARAMAHNERYAAHSDAKRLIDVAINVEGPFGVVGIPDPHLNNPGTLLRRAFDDAKVIAEHPALYAVGIGDWLDNFIIGRLERERRGDIMSHADANRLQDHYIMTIINKMIIGLGGNHNDWIKDLGGVDFIHLLFKRMGVSAIYDPDEVRVRLVTPSGATFIHLGRHVFPGHSRFNSVHGILSWMLERWQGEDVLWGGHTHQAGHAMLEREHEGVRRTVHGVQLAAYKDIDRYAIKGGFRRNVPFLVPMVVHDPDRRKTIFFDDMYDGLKHLDMLRDEYGMAAAA